MVLTSFCHAQEINGQLNINGKSKVNLELTNHSAVQLFKEFLSGRYKTQFSFKASDVPKNKYDETVVHFEFITTVKKDGKLVKNVIRKQPIPYFPGDIAISGAESFDFISILSTMNSKGVIDPEVIKSGKYGVMPAGLYEVQLMVRPVGFKGEISPVNLMFNVSK